MKHYILSLLIAILSMVIISACSEDEVVVPEPDSTYWYEQTSGVTQMLRAVSFVDKYNGFVIGGDDDGSVILKSSNGGTNWVLNETKIGLTLEDVCFVDINIGWAIGHGGEWTNYYGVILRTTNGGLSWSNRGQISGDVLYGGSFLDANIGWVVGWTGKIHKTTDGGNTWQLQYNNSQIELSAINFIDANTGWAIGNPGKILKTTNGGVIWDVQSTVYTEPFTSLCFINANTGWVASHARLLKTTNGGIIWSEQPSAGLPSVSFVDVNNGIIAGSTGSKSLIYRTTDSGTTWSQQYTSKERTILNDVQFMDANTGTAVGGFWNGSAYEGVILRTK